MPTPARGHEVLEHTADLGLRAWAPSLEELFAEAAVGMIALMGRTDAGEPVAVDVSLEAPDLDALFVDWLSEVLFLFDARDLVPQSAEVRITRDPLALQGVVRGVQATGFVQTGPAVKAVTYHGLELMDTEARVYLDV